MNGKARARRAGTGGRARAAAAAPRTRRAARLRDGVVVLDESSGRTAADRSDGRLDRILIVEDDPDIRTLTSLALATFGGFTVKTCSSGVEALACAPEFRPELVLLDVMMPAMDGFGTLAALREMPATANVPVIFLTARVQPQDIGRYKELGSLAVIQKPFEPSRLADTIKGIWSKARCPS